MLRSCYSTDMVFGTDTAVTAKVQWYWCDEGALALGIPTPFCSRNWTNPLPYPDLGEVEDAPRPWRNGSFPIAVPGQTGPCGNPTVWLNGWPGPTPTGLQRSNIGLAWCCRQPGTRPGEPLFLFFPIALTSIASYWAKSFFGGPFWGRTFFP
jgi:hypothetical protein